MKKQKILGFKQWLENKSFKTKFLVNSTTSFNFYSKEELSLKVMGICDTLEKKYDIYIHRNMEIDVDTENQGYYHKVLLDKPSGSLGGDGIAMVMGVGAVI